MKTENSVKKAENKQIKKTISVLSVKLGHTDLMIVCWMSQPGACNPSTQKRLF